MPLLRPLPVRLNADRPSGSGGQPAAPQGPDVLDPAALARLRELDPTGQARLIERVIDAYLGSADRLAAQLRDARERGDAPGVRMVAHTLKSSSASVGALALSQHCAYTESLARDRGMVDELGPAIDALLEHLSVAIRALLALKGTGTA